MESNIEHTGWEPRLVWRSREEGPGGSSGIPTRCQALPGAYTGILKQERQGPCPQGGTSPCVCVCVCVCVKCVYMCCVCVSVLCLCVCEIWYTYVVCVSVCEVWYICVVCVVYIVPVCVCEVWYIYVVCVSV